MGWLGIRYRPSEVSELCSLNYHLDDSDHNSVARPFRHRIYCRVPASATKIKVFDMKTIFSFRSFSCDEAITYLQRARRTGTIAVENALSRRQSAQVPLKILHQKEIPNVLPTACSTPRYLCIIK